MRSERKERERNNTGQHQEKGNDATEDPSSDLRCVGDLSRVRERQAKGETNLKVFPDNLIWFRCMGDLDFVPA